MAAYEGRGNGWKGRKMVRGRVGEEKEEGEEEEGGYQTRKGRGVGREEEKGGRVVGSQRRIQVGRRREGEWGGDGGGGRVMRVERGWRRRESRERMIREEEEEEGEKMVFLKEKNNYCPCRKKFGIFKFQRHNVPMKIGVCFY